MKRIDYHIRDLAKSDYWQGLYSASEKINGINLFENTTNFTNLQYQFLQWLSIYSMLYQELEQHESKYLSEAVINDMDRTDAYLYMRRKKIETDWKKYQKEKEKQEVEAKFSKKKKHLGENAEICDVQFKG